MAKTERQPKEFTYATLILSHIQSMFQKETENYINPDEFKDPENLKAFLHALATIAPASIYNKITGEEKDSLEFNHIANTLVFEYSEKMK